jgi:hypothetical protein
MAHGPAVKHLNRFPRKFWEDHHLSPSAIWNYLGSVWESTDQQTGQGELGLSIYAGGQYARAEPTYPRPAGPSSPRVRPRPDPLRRLAAPAVKHLTGYYIPAPRQVSTVARALSARPSSGGCISWGADVSGIFGYMEGALRSGTGLLGGRWLRSTLARSGRIRIDLVAVAAAAWPAAKSDETDGEGLCAPGQRCATLYRLPRGDDPGGNGL